MSNTDKVVETTTKVVEKAGNVDTTALQAKVVSMLDALQNGAVKIGNTVVKYAPDVADAVLMVVRIDGIQVLVAGFALLLFMLTLWRKWFCASIIWAKDDKYNNPGPVFSVSGLGLVGIGCTIAIWMCLLDVWVWVQVFEPKLYIAKKIVDTALGL